MPTFGVYTVTGEGSEDFGSFVSLAYVNTWVSVLGKTDVLTSGQPKRIMHAGWWGLGPLVAPFTGAPVAISWWKYLEFEAEETLFLNKGVGAVGARLLHYHLLPGVTCQFFAST
jgi:hypothetical protein